MVLLLWLPALQRQPQVQHREMDEYGRVFTSGLVKKLPIRRLPNNRTGPCNFLLTLLYRCFKATFEHPDSCVKAIITHLEDMQSGDFQLYCTDPHHCSRHNQSKQIPLGR